MKIKPLLPGIGVYLVTSDDGLKKFGRIAHRKHDNADLPWFAEKQGFVGKSQQRFRTLNEARAWFRA